VDIVSSNLKGRLQITLIFERVGDKTHNIPYRERQPLAAAKPKASRLDAVVGRVAVQWRIPKLTLVAFTRRTMLSGTKLNEKIGSMSSTSITDK
jgi:hypothetical protein